MKLKRKVSLGPLTYRIEATKEAARHLASQDCYAIINHHQQVIWVRPDLPPERLFTAIIHELLHGVDYTYFGHERFDEPTVTVLANGLGQALMALGFELTYD